MDKNANVAKAIENFLVKYYVVRRIQLDGIHLKVDIDKSN